MTTALLVLQIFGVFYRAPEIGFELFFLTDSCSQDLALQESDSCHLGTIEHFEIFKMASRMVAKYMLALVWLCLGLKYLFLFAIFGCKTIHLKLPDISHT